MCITFTFLLGNANALHLHRNPFLAALPVATSNWQNVTRVDSCKKLRNDSADSQSICSHTVHVPTLPTITELSTLASTSSSVSRRPGQAQWVRPSLAIETTSPCPLGVSRSPQSHQDLQSLFVVVFRRQIAHVAVQVPTFFNKNRTACTASWPRAASRPCAILALIQYGLHAKVRRTVREHFQLQLHSTSANS